MPSTISVEELEKNVAAVLARVHDRGEHFTVEQDGEPVASLMPPLGASITLRELLRKLRELSPADESFADDLEAVQQSQPVIEMPRWDS